MLFDLPTWALALTIVVVVFGATALGAWIGSRSRHLGTNLSEPLGVLQGALLGVVGLILAFGLSLALSRYEDRRATVVEEANAIGTTYLRAQMLEPRFSAPSLRLLDQYAESAVDVADRIPDSDAEMDAIAAEERIQGRLWLLARAAVADQPVQTAPRLYIETLNEMIDAQATRQAALANRVPTPVLLLELFGAAVAHSRARRLPGADRARDRRRLPRRRPGQLPALRDGRSRPADARSDQGPRHSARQRLRSDHGHAGVGHAVPLRPDPGRAASIDTIAA